MNKSRADIVVELIALHGVPRQFHEGAQSALASLTNEQLEIELKQALTDQAAVLAWRERRVRSNTATVRTQESSKTAPSFTEKLADRTAHRAALLVRKEIYKIALKRLAPNSYRGKRQNYSRVLNSLLKNDKIMAKVIARKEFDNVAGKIEPTAHPVISQRFNEIDITEFLEATGRLGVEIAQKKPDLLVAVNAEGANICDFCKDLNLFEMPIAHVEVDAARTMDWHDIIQLHPAPTICVVGHITHSGKSLRTVIDDAKTRFYTKKVFGAVLIASDESLTGSLEDIDILYHQRAEHNRLTLTKRYVRRSNGGFIVRDVSSGKEIDISRDLFEEVTQAVNSRYNRQMFAWESD